ncbi:MAG: thermonuclease family protein [Deltaproteobacteria bacterium]|nr:thermonuclease family protein [Deltaproteobacteria bacterium]
MKPIVLRKRIVALFALLLAACVGGPLPAERRQARKATQALLAQVETSGLIIGEFTLSRRPVIDGDTIRIDGLRTSLRLAGIDTEETFKAEKDRRAFEAGWESYLTAMRGSSPRPVKMATPVGEEAKKFAERFFEDVELVRLERDHPKEIRDYYNRYLAYVIARKNGAWVNYNVECVRAGMSPYFMKYGYSRRFHEDFVRAQDEARAAKRGIWDPTKLHYPDYAERLRWWTSRAEFVQKFETEADESSDHVVLTHWDSMRRLEERVGKEVVILGAVAEIRLGDRGPTKVLLSRRMHSDFPLIFFDKDVFLGSGASRYQGEFVKVRGVVNRYHDPHKNMDELQIIVRLPSQLSGPDRETTRAEAGK